MSDGLRRALLLAAGSLVALAGGVCLSSCSHESHSGPEIACGAVGGVWAMTMDDGSGLLAHQSWTIAQSGCDVTMTGEPADLYGPYLGSETAIGSAGGDSLWARWSHRYAPCEFTCEASATVSGSVMNGDVFWVRSSYGAGYCPPASGKYLVSGTR